jgi:hypothetical protein
VIRDLDIRLRLRAEIIEEFSADPGSIVLDELGILEGTCRIDLAVVNGQLHAYEIKSDADTLERLATQATAYNSVFDRITIAAGRRHADKVLASVPEWWGLMTAVSDGTNVTLLRERAACDNAQVDSVAVASLLWRDELVSVLKERCAGRGLSGLPRWRLRKLLAALLPITELKAVVRSTLKLRKDWRPDALRT